MLTSYGNGEGNTLVVFANTICPRTLRRMRKNWATKYAHKTSARNGVETETCNPLFNVERLVKHGSSQRKNRAFRPCGLHIRIAPATLEAQLHNQHRHGNREAANHLQRQQKERSTAAEPTYKRTLAAMQYSGFSEAGGRSHKHSQQRKDLPIGFEAYLRKNVFGIVSLPSLRQSCSEKHARRLAESFRSQTLVEYGSLFAVRYGRSARACTREVAYGEEA